MEATYFATPGAFRAWLARHHQRAEALWVGYHKVGSARPSITWPQSVDEALCFGWIDGLRQRIDDTRYRIRFTPRKARSIWSAVNLARIEALVAAGRVQPAGLAVFRARSAERSERYSYEQRSVALPEPYAGKLRRARNASRFFEAQAASYRKAAMWWVVSAKQEATRLRRLDLLIAHSARGERIPQFMPRKVKP